MTAKKKPAKKKAAPKRPKTYGMFTHLSSDSHETEFFIIEGSSVSQIMEAFLKRGGEMSELRQLSFIKGEVIKPDIQPGSTVIVDGTPLTVEDQDPLRFEIEPMPFYKAAELINGTCNLDL